MCPLPTDLIICWILAVLTLNLFLGTFALPGPAECVGIPGIFSWASGRWPPIFVRWLPKLTLLQPGLFGFKGLLQKWILCGILLLQLMKNSVGVSAAETTTMFPLSNLSISLQPLVLVAPPWLMELGLNLPFPSCWGSSEAHCSSHLSALLYVVLCLNFKIAELYMKRLSSVD